MSTFSEPVVTRRGSTEPDAPPAVLSEKTLSRPTSTRIGLSPDTALTEGKRLLQHPQCDGVQYSSTV